MLVPYKYSIKIKIENLLVKLENLEPYANICTGSREDGNPKARKLFSHIFFVSQTLALFTIYGHVE